MEEDIKKVIELTVDELRSRCRLASKDLLSRLLEIAYNPKTPTRDVIRVAELVFERGYGKVMQELRHSGVVDVPLSISLKPYEVPKLGEERVELVEYEEESDENRQEDGKEEPEVG